MSIEITLDPVTLAKVEKSAALAGLSTSQFLENFFSAKVGLPCGRTRRAFLRQIGRSTIGGGAA